MLETDPIANATAALQATVMEVLKGGDPNKLRGPYCAMLRAMGRGKFARVVEELPPLPYRKVQR